MSTTMSVLGGVGLFLRGMGVMTGGLTALAGSRLRQTLSEATATPLSGTFWGAFVTLLVQSSSATTMTTIGLVSAGLLTFSKGLALVFGANIGTTGTCTFGLTTLQQGMSGMAETPAPRRPSRCSWSRSWLWSGLLGVLALIVVGLAMTTVMQSSTAAIAVTLSAHHAGALGLDQACALVIGQNIGTATSSALAAIGASSTAKRLALAYILFKLIAAAIALVLFPVTIPLLVRALNNVDGVTLLAGYHTAYNVVGVAVLLPVIERFTHVVERILPERRSALTRPLDPAALVIPLAAEEAVRRTVARSLGTMCASIGDALITGKAVSVAQASDAVRQAREFMSEATARRTSAQDHAIDASDREVHAAPPMTARSTASEIRNAGITSSGSAPRRLL